jgi:lysyl-tRNA synthetase class 2
MNLSGGLLDEAGRDTWLDLLMSSRVGPRLGLGAPAFLHDFPASQAALARVRPGEPPLAERFELFWKGIELANGFHELTDAAEQRRRFEQDRARRAAEGREAPPYDAHLVEALEAGMPDCAGVALGLDRLLMLLLDLPELGDALAFDAERA